MSNIYVQDMPDVLYQRIQERAHAHRRSINEEIINLLEEALEKGERTQAQILADIRRRRFIPLPPLP